METLEDQNKKIAELMVFANQLDNSIKTDEEFIKRKNKIAKDLEINVKITDQE